MLSIFAFRLPLSLFACISDIPIKIFINRVLDALKHFYRGRTVVDKRVKLALMVMINALLVDTFIRFYAVV